MEEREQFGLYWHECVNAGESTLVHDIRTNSSVRPTESEPSRTVTRPDTTLYSSHVTAIVTVSPNAGFGFVVT